MLRTSSSSDGSGSKKAWGPTFGEGPKTKQAWSLRFGREGLEILSFFDCQGSEPNIQYKGSSPGLARAWLSKPGPVLLGPGPSLSSSK